MPPNDARPRAPRAVLAVGLAAAAAAGVAVLASGARGSGAGGGIDLGGDATRALTDAGMVAMLSFGSAMLLVALVVVLLRGRDGRAAELTSRRSSLVPTLVVAGVLLVTAPLLDRLFEWIGPPEEQEQDVMEIAPVDLEVQPGDGGAAEDSGTTPLLVGLVVGLLGAVAVTAWFAGPRRRLAPPSVPQAETVEERRDRLRVLLDDALGDLRDDPDPRRAVISAWARFELAVAAVGQPRRDAETPTDFVARVLDAVDVSGPLVRRLGDSFERAMFSPHAIDRAAQLEAVEALRAVRDELHVGASA
ncbi:DUF4129 domain-containing protein [Actinomarinicola tropica]|uniref:DUF4129 domain-containing protein n=1 Tax=Actinomarinicola tropica TaxID=2789776 RepID=A0A5Q2RSG8_9ACTN|nr:DUF4129 domain-containing protein [Actinomarinicola tropica]QGG96850.1 DUF4129 domain-containing protein [Actinomarinicola tropica]